MAFRKAWQKMKRTLSSETRQFLVTSELWEIFLAKEPNHRSSIEKLQLMTQKLEKILDRNEHEFSSRIEPSNEKGNLKIIING